MADAISELNETAVVPGVLPFNDDRSTPNLVLQKRQVIEYITNCFSDEQKIGSGKHGEVYKGVYNGQEISVKKLYQMPGLNDVAFENTFHNLMNVQHKNIIQSVGYCYELQHNKPVEHKGGNVIAHADRVLCIEYLQGGCLDSHIYDESCGPDLKTRFKIIRGSCEGLNFIHNGQKDPIYHLNLKPANILLDKNMVPKIADFGLSRLFASATNHKTKINHKTKNTFGTTYVCD